MQQVFRIGERIENRSLRHFCANRGLQPGQPHRRLLARQLGQDRLAVLNAKSIVLREGPVRVLGDPAEPQLTVLALPRGEESSRRQPAAQKQAIAGGPTGSAGESA